MRGVVGRKVGQRVEEGPEPRRVRGGGILGVELQVGDAAADCLGEGDHGHGPSADTDGRQGLALRVKVGNQAWRHVPVVLEVHVLDGVHG